MKAEEEGIVKVGGMYYYFKGRDMPWENTTRVYPEKKVVVEETVTGYDSTSTERSIWRLFKDDNGNHYQVREGKSWVKTYNYIGDKKVVDEKAFDSDDPDAEEAYEFARKSLDI